jgi:SAM-dependent methyltransferase
MAFSLSAFKVKQRMNLSSDLDIFFKSKEQIQNGYIYLVPIEDSIQYATLLTNTYDMYQHYIQLANQSEHSTEKFQTLLSTFSLKHMPPIEVNVYDHSTFFWVQDGIHRLSIAKYKKLFNDSIPFEYVTINFYEKAQDILRDALRKTVSGSNYNGWHNRTEFGYHSFDLFNIHIPGQRSPVKRFEKIKKFYDFTGKRVLDLGCNTGGMLFHIPEIQQGIGIDYDDNCIQSCKIFRERLNFACELDFFRGDLNELTIVEFCKEKTFSPDIVFLLSLGSWVKSWRKLYIESYRVSNTVLLETNNDGEGKEQLNLFIQLGAHIQLVSDKSDDDSTGNTGRKTYLITKPTLNLS